MFEYIRNEYNPRPRLVLDAPARTPGMITAHFRYATALSFALPTTDEGYRALQGRKYWTDHRRRERRLLETVSEMRFRRVTDEAGLRELLPRIQELFADRWSTEYTSFAWKTEAGFEPYAEAMLELARQGRAEAVALEADGVLLSFAYCLIEDGTYYFYQHASTRRSRYRPMGVGSLLVAKLIEDLVRERRCARFDFGTGASAYKRLWASDEKQIYFRIEEDRTPAGYARFALRWVYRRARFYVQFSNPRLRMLTRAALFRADRVRRRLQDTGDGPPQPLVPASNTRTP